MKFLFALIGTAAVGAGCVKTVNEGHAFAWSWAKDSVEGRYERPVEQVFIAAKDVVRFNGTLLNEQVLHSTTNEVKTIEGRVNQKKVWIRVEPVDSKVTSVIVQARSGGGTEVETAHEIEKQIALKLASQ